MSNTPNAMPEENIDHPETVLKNNSLPEGWKKVQMTKHPKIMWYENEAGHSQWYPPGGEEIEPVLLEENNSLPSEWRKASFKNNVDPKQYWYESLNGQTSWNKPQGPLLPPKNNAPKNNAPKNNAPKNNTPKNNAPKNNVPTNNTPKNNAPKNSKFKNVFNKLNNIRVTLNNLSNKLKGGRTRKQRKSRR